MPLAWRRNLVVAVYLYMRDGELRELHYADVDLEHVVVNVRHAYNRRTKHSKSTKTGEPRPVPMHENLLPLLRAVHAEANGVTGGRGSRQPDRRPFSATLSPMAAVRVDPNNVREFKDEHSFYTWLGKHWDKEKEVWIKIHKVRSGFASITPAQAIDVVLCWGWIDGIRKGFDEKCFLQRYTPRGKKSVWSQINVANVKRLTRAGRMQPSGLAQVAAAKADGRWVKAYSFTKTAAPKDLLAAIRAEPKALVAFEGLSSQNRFALIFRTLSMKTAVGRKKKIAGFVEMLKEGKTIHPNGKAAPTRTARQRQSKTQ